MAGFPDGRFERSFRLSTSLLSFDRREYARMDKIGARKLFARNEYSRYRFELFHWIIISSFSNMRREVEKKTR